MGRTARQPAPRDAALFGARRQQARSVPRQVHDCHDQHRRQPGEQIGAHLRCRRIPVEERLPDQPRQAEFEGSAARWETGVGFRSRCLT